MTNNSKASFEGFNKESAKYWLEFVLTVWMNATHGSHECMSEYQAALAVIREIKLDDSDLEPLQRVFNELRSALNSLSSNETCTTLKLDDDTLRIGWYGTWTPGRYVFVSYGPSYDEKVIAEWDTATDRESTFLNLPSSIENYVKSGADPEARIFGLEQEEVDRRQEIVVELTNTLRSVPCGFSVEKTEAGVRDYARRLAQFIKNRLANPNVRIAGDGYCYQARGWGNICETYVVADLSSCLQNVSVDRALHQIYSDDTLKKVFKRAMDDLVDYEEILQAIWECQRGEPRTTVVEGSGSIYLQLPVDIIRLFYDGGIQKNTCVEIGRGTAEFLHPVIV